MSGPLTAEKQSSIKMIGITVLRVDMGLMAVLLGVLCCQVLASASDDVVVACGGFVKSDVEINYSLIEVRGRKLG